ncbi:ELWxxDGT repeat protein [Fischerella thermalis]|uniref:ELWxxDGT repeat protein n=1 Tax=Fischerella thermalis TaxID=372787 RepID=UPI001A0627E5|nr:ELWxxDGT repeat protein [Fischerella thermalis]MBF2069258.1 pre-peptidase C-terminal domain-containing protein [Fischerella thermalis M48_A2018_028]
MATFSGFPDPGSTRSTALDTTSASYIGGSLSSTPNIFQDSISNLDTSDFYKFTISGSSASAVSFLLNGLSDDARLRLYDDSGSSVALQTASSSSDGTIPALLARSLNAGTYYIRVESISGSSTSYNLTLTANVIPTDNGSGNSTATALDIGTLTSSYNAIDYVGNKGVVIDTDDYYKFNITNNGTLNVSLDGLGGNANIELYDQLGSKIASSTLIGISPESIIKSLASGTYYVRVFPGGSGGDTNYHLSFSFTADPVDNAGNTINDARDINPLSSTPSTFSDFVNSADPNDYYRFDLTSDALVDILLTPETANANLQLLDSSGTSIISSTLTSTTPDSIIRSLIAGTYYIRVYPASNSQTTNYNLSVSAQTIGADIAGNARSTAKDIGTLNGSRDFSDFVGTIDTRDVYKFTLSNNSVFNLTLSGLIANADVELLNSSGTVLLSSTNTGNADESINTDLVAGTYYVRIKQITPAETFYNLNLFAGPKTQMLEIVSGSGSPDPKNLTAVGNTLYFTANDGSNGVQLWRSDGTTNTRLTGINPSGFNPANLTAVGSNLFFTANDGTNGTELWMYDGSSVQMVANINTSGNSDPTNLTAVGSKLFFSANDGINGRELWVYDNGTVSLVQDIYVGTNSSNPSNFTAFSGKLYFTATNSTNGIELWSSDGTSATMVADIRSGGFSSSPSKLTVVGNTLYFRANNGSNGAELWKSDGTTGGTSLVKDITPGTSGFGPDNLIAVGNTLFFVTDSNNDFQQELWKSDGTASGTVLVKSNLSAAPNIGLGAFNLAAVGNTLYFTTYDTATGLELWKSDGTDAGTSLVRDIWEGADPNSSIPTSLVNFGGTLYFVASEPENGTEVWSSDGTDAGTQRVSDINPAAGDANPTQLTVVGNKLFFTATNGINGTELWVIG